MIRVAFYGAGQLSTNAAGILRRRGDVQVLGPFGRAEREHALGSGASVVVIATTSFLSEIADDISWAIESGSNVITTAEEAAYPWATDAETADRLDALARSRGVSILGAGLNPGFAFDALVLTACGAVPEVESLLVERVVDLSGFGEVVLRRIGVGHDRESFERGRHSGAVTGHIGFPQSMRVVAAQLGVRIDHIETKLEPIFAETELLAGGVPVKIGQTAGFRQRYTAMSDGQAWFVAVFTGHVNPAALGEEPRDTIRVDSPSGVVQLQASPGLNPQTASASIIANSIRRIIAAAPGWRTVGELCPAIPA